MTGSLPPWLSRAPTPRDLALHDFAGAPAGGGFALPVLAHGKAPVAVSASFRCSRMPNKITIEALLFGDLAGTATLAGASAGTVSGFYVFDRDAVRGWPGAA